MVPKGHQFSERKVPFKGYCYLTFTNVTSQLGEKGGVKRPEVKGAQKKTAGWDPPLGKGRKFYRKGEGARPSLEKARPSLENGKGRGLP